MGGGGGIHPPLYVRGLTGTSDILKVLKIRRAFRQVKFENFQDITSTYLSRIAREGRAICYL